MGHLVEARPAVIGHADVFDDLVDLEAFEDDQRIFLGADLAGLDRVVDQVRGRGHRLGAERLEGVEDHLARRHADFHAGEIVRLDHGRATVVTWRMPLSKPRDRKQIHSLGRHLLADVGAERSVDRRVRLRRRT